MAVHFGVRVVSRGVSFVGCSNSGTHFAAKANVCFWYTDCQTKLQGDASGATILYALKDKLGAAACPYTEAESGGLLLASIRG